MFSFLLMFNKQTDTINVTLVSSTISHLSFYGEKSTRTSTERDDAILQSNVNKKYFKKSLLFEYQLYLHINEGNNREREREKKES